MKHAVLILILVGCVDDPSVPEATNVDGALDVIAGVKPTHGLDECPGGDGGGSGGGGERILMDPEPDRNKDRKSCWDWCAWDRRQCEKECRHRHPDRDMNERNRCIRSCENKFTSCKVDCNIRVPERPIAPAEPTL